MKTFKDFIKPDLDVFINPDEFGYYHNINGEDILCLVDEDLFDERSTTKDDLRQGGVYQKIKSIFIKKIDIEKPAIDEQLRLDAELYLVVNVNEAGSLFEIQIEKMDH